MAVSLEVFIEQTEELFDKVLASLSQESPARDDMPSSQNASQEGLFRARENFVFVNKILLTALADPKCWPIVRATGESQIAGIGNVLCMYP